MSASILNQISCYLGDNGRLTASVIGGSGGNTYFWNNSSSWSNNPINNNLTVGSYTVVAKDVNGCMDTTEITLLQPSELTISVTDTDINCYGENSGFITAVANGGTPIPGIPPEYNYSWSNSFSEQTSVSTVLNLGPGIYTVTAYDQNGCDIVSESIYINQPSNPLSLTLDSIDETCLTNDGGVNSFVLGGTPPYLYAWNNGATSANISNLSPAIYTVEVTDLNGCSISGTTTVNGVSNIFLPGNTSSIDTSICLGESVFVDIQENPLLTYEWGDGPFEGYLQADRVITPSEGISVYVLNINDPSCPTYSVEVIISVDAVDPKITADKSTFQFSVPNFIFPDITSSIKTVSAETGSSLELSSENNNCDSYMWEWSNSYSNNQSFTISNINLSDQGWYYLSVDSAGCIGMDSIYVIIGEEGGIKPYDAFTPNGDNDNENWNIVSIENYPQAIVQIYNRWGSLIFETSGGDDYVAWDGTNNGEELPIGTYYYIIDLKLFMNVFVLLYNLGTEKEGIHSIELKGRTIVLMFEDKDDAERYCGLLEAQDFPLPSVELINIDEIRDFCNKLDYESKLVEKNFVPKSAEDRLLISPPQKNLEVENWNQEESKEENIDLNSIKENLEKLL